MKHFFDDFVSILILLEVTLEVVNFPDFVLLGTTCFNPYSIGSYSGRRLMCFSFICLFVVSILILLEVTLEVITNCTIDDFERCFNPYSIGSYSGSRQRCNG